MMRAPMSRMDVLSESEIQDINNNSKLVKNILIDRESAYEMLIKNTVIENEAAAEAQKKRMKSRTNATKKPEPLNRQQPVL
jgi:uncharacterized protein YdbL (DUF1318 family)